MTTTAGTAVTRAFANAEAVVEDILATVGKEIVLGLPLGLGKANHIVNAFYRRARSDRSISLRIVTALSLARPRRPMAAETSTSSAPDP